MAHGEGRGGYRRPSQPAPVAGPGTLSRRTDGSASNPILNAPSPAYGAGVALQRQVAGAPLPSGGTGAASPSQGQFAPVSAPTDMFAPTQRPDEPITAGIPFGPGPGGPPLPEDATETIRAMYSVLPHPHIAELLTEFDV